MPPEHPQDDEPLADLFADVDLDADDGVLPDLTVGGVEPPDDLAGEWEPAAPPTLPGTDGWAPAVPSAAGRRRDRRTTRRGRRAAEDDVAVAAAGDDSSGTGTTAEPPTIPDDRPVLEPSTLFSDDDPPAGQRKRPKTAEERLQHAITLAYRHVTKRDRTVAEVRTHLEKRSVDATSLQGALDELTEVGYLDDGRYAERYVEDKRRLEGWGRLRIEQGLRRTGIDRELVDAALADDPLQDDEGELAVEALEQRLRGLPPDGDRGRQKALRMLATKGYALETAYAAVRTYEERCAERAGD
jgi:regulatory protein